MPRQFRAPLDMGSSKITNLAEPAAAQDAATKSYVDTEFLSLSGDVTVAVGGAATVSATARKSYATRVAARMIFR